MDSFKLTRPELTRRDFIKVAGATLALLGLSQALTPKVVKALEESIGKPAVVWLEGQDCAGCTESFLNSLEPPAVSILLDSISLRYHETAMVASGHQAEEALASTIEEGGHILVIEGSIPLAEDGLFCTVGGKPFKLLHRGVVSQDIVSHFRFCHSLAHLGSGRGYGVTSEIMYVAHMNRIRKPDSVSQRSIISIRFSCHSPFLNHNHRISVSRP